MPKRLKVYTRGIPQLIRDGETNYDHDIEFNIEHVDFKQASLNKGTIRIIKNADGVALNRSGVTSHIKIKKGARPGDRFLVAFFNVEGEGHKII